VIVGTIFLLIALTLAFEHFKHHLEEHSSEDTKLILEKLFGELTILGFLAMTIFFIHHSGLLETISHRIHFEEEELIEYVENIHYALFSVMIFFVFQVMVLLRFANETAEQWTAMDKACQDASLNKTEWIPTEQERQSLSNLQAFSWITLLVPQLVNKDDETIRDTVIFRALRHEFILDRSPDPPFPAKTAKKRLVDFNFGRYLAHAQSRVLAHVVEVEQEAWLCFAVATLVFYAFALAVRENMVILAWFWAATGWFVFLFNAVFEMHLIDLRRSFLPRRIDALLYESTPSLHDNNERGCDFALLEEKGVDALPGWCDVDPEHYVNHERWWVTQKFVGGKPNRQQTLFWMDRHGPHIYMLILQVNLIFTGVHVGLLLLVFVPDILEDATLTISIIYCFFAFIPVIGIMYNKKRIVATLAQVCSVGCYRKWQIVRDVLRQQKTVAAVRTFVAIHNMHSLDQEGKDNTTEKKKLVGEDSERSALSESGRAQVHKTFDAFDTDGSGDISYDELKSLLARMGISSSPESFGRITAALDEDGNGFITRDEFVNWYTSMIGSSMSLDTLARQMFDAFDVDNSGEVTLGEFKERLDMLSGNGFTLDEIGAIVNELDVDRSGTVDFEEFLAFLARHMPEEMSSDISMQDEAMCHILS